MPIGQQFTRKTLKPAIGVTDGLRKKVSVSFDPEVFDRIAKMRYYAASTPWKISKFCPANAGGRDE